MKRNRLTLERIKRSALARKLLLGRAEVRIWSNQWLAWWRPRCSGYTDDPEQAGIYSGAEAFQSTSHAGPEKGIQYELIQP